MHIKIWWSSLNVDEFHFEVRFQDWCLKVSSMKPQPSRANLAPFITRVSRWNLKPINFIFTRWFGATFFIGKSPSIFTSDANNESRVGSLRDSASHPTTSQANGGLAYTFCPANQGMLCNGWREKVMFEGKVGSEISSTSNGTYW